MILIETVDEAVQVSIGARTWIGHTGGIEVEEDHAAEVRNALHLAGQLYIDEDDGDPVQPPAIVEDPNNGSI
jgi:hypothetical protein